MKLLFQGVELSTIIVKPLKMYCDNSTIMFFSKNDKYSKGVKHMELKYFVMKKKVQKQIVSIENISTNPMIADPLTKGLLSKSFIEPIENMNIIVIKDCRVYCLLLFWIVDILSSFMICL